MAKRSRPNVSDADQFANISQSFLECLERVEIIVAHVLSVLIINHPLESQFVFARPEDASWYNQIYDRPARDCLGRKLSCVQTSCPCAVLISTRKLLYSSSRSSPI